MPNPISETNKSRDYALAHELEIEIRTKVRDFNYSKADKRDFGNLNAITQITLDLGDIELSVAMGEVMVGNTFPFPYDGDVTKNMLGGKVTNKASGDSFYLYNGSSAGKQIVYDVFQRYQDFKHPLPVELKPDPIPDLDDVIVKWRKDFAESS